MSEIRQAQYELASGVTLTVTPLTGFMVQALHARATQLYPDVDREPYQVEIADALVAGTKTRAEDHPEWLQRMSDVLKRRAQAQMGLLLDATLNVPDREALIAPYLPTVKAVKEAMQDFPIAAAMLNDFLVVLIGVLAEKVEVDALVRLAQGATPLSDAEVLNGMRHFRSVVLSRQRRSIRPRASEGVQGIPTEGLSAARPAPAGDGGGGEVQPDPRPDDDGRSGSELV